MVSFLIPLKFEFKFVNYCRDNMYDLLIEFLSKGFN